MRHFLFIALLFPSVALGQWKEGFNARDTSGYCTDPADTQYFRMQGNDGGDIYPVTRNGVTFGATGNIGDPRRNRNASVDCRLAGSMSRANNTASPGVVRVDLPSAGQYTFRLAMGQEGSQSAIANNRVQIYDDTTLLLTVDDASIASNHFTDATGVERTSAADWVTNNASVTLTFATTTFFLKFGYGDGSTSGTTVVSHWNLEQVQSHNPAIIFRGLGDL